MKTKLIELLKQTLHTQHGADQCKTCKKSMLKLTSALHTRHEVDVKFKPHGKSGYHIEIIKIHNDETELYFNPRTKGKSRLF